MQTKLPQDIEHFVEGLEKEESPGRWGFTVFSTYPASTEEAFDKQVCERFQARIGSSLRFTVNGPYGLNIPLDIEYIRLPSASIPEARRHFRAKYGFPEKHERGILRDHAHRYEAYCFCCD